MFCKVFYFYNQLFHVEHYFYICRTWIFNVLYSDCFSMVWSVQKFWPCYRFRPLCVIAHNSTMALRPNIISFPWLKSIWYGIPKCSYPNFQDVILISFHSIFSLIFTLLSSSNHPTHTILPPILIECNTIPLCHIQKMERILYSCGFQGSAGNRPMLFSVCHRQNW